MKQQRPPIDPAHEPDDGLQGEGNYKAARRHRASVKRFIDNERVDAAADAAAPRTEAEQADMKEAEKAGLARARH